MYKHIHTYTYMYIKLTTPYMYMYIRTCALIVQDIKVEIMHGGMPVDMHAMLVHD